MAAARSAAAAPYPAPASHPPAGQPKRNFLPRVAGLSRRGQTPLARPVPNKKALPHPQESPGAAVLGSANPSTSSNGETGELVAQIGQAHGQRRGNLLPCNSHPPTMAAARSAEAAPYPAPASHPPAGQPKRNFLPRVAGLSRRGQTPLARPVPNKKALPHPQESPGAAVLGSANPSTSSNGETGELVAQIGQAHGQRRGNLLPLQFPSSDHGSSPICCGCALSGTCFTSTPGQPKRNFCPSQDSAAEVRRHWLGQYPTRRHYLILKNRRVRRCWAAPIPAPVTNGETGELVAQIGQAHGQRRGTYCLAIPILRPWQQPDLLRLRPYPAPASHPPAGQPKRNFLPRVAGLSRRGQTPLARPVPNKKALPHPQESPGAAVLGSANPSTSSNGETGELVAQIAYCLRNSHPPTMAAARSAAAAPYPAPASHPPAGQPKRNFLPRVAGLSRRGQTPLARPVPNKKALPHPQESPGAAVLGSANPSTSSNGETGELVAQIGQAHGQRRGEQPDLLRLRPYPAPASHPPAGQPKRKFLPHVAGLSRRGQTPLARPVPNKKALPHPQESPGAAVLGSANPSTSSNGETGELVAQIGQAHGQRRGECLKLSLLNNAF
ncbi:uncharacterized protein LOC121405219 [Drosophila obscura]|uniref:uncharacterized protein LOC121405219 n=1 Tax=Drosophila obscura TaxID=7282 RepID=UPI001BB2951E|nr:uncharacterized protein LOC121405219 [Drosophila obscura]